MRTSAIRRGLVIAIGLLAVSCASGVEQRREVSPESAPPLSQNPAPTTISVPSPGDSAQGGGYVQVDELPEAIEKVAPEYPEAARAKKVDGTVMLQALVGVDGTVSDVVVQKSIPELDQAAMDCVKRWRFKPALSAGSPVPVRIAIPIRFSLH